MEKTYQFTVVIVGYNGYIRVTACTPYHAKQVAYGKWSHMCADINRYKVRPRVSKPAQAIINKF